MRQSDTQFTTTKMLIIWDQRLCIKKIVIWKRSFFWQRRTV